MLYLYISLFEFFNNIFNKYLIDIILEISNIPKYQ